MMRVLIYCDDPGCGGTAVNAALLAAGLAGAGFAVALAASADITAGAPGVAFVPIDYDTMRESHKTAASRNEPEAIFLAVRPDLVIFGDGAVDSSLAAKAVCRDWDLPYVVHLNYIAPAVVQRLGLCLDEVGRAMAAALAVVAVSAENLALARLVFGLPADQSRVILNGRPLDFFASPPASARLARRAALGLGPEDVLCLTVARFEPRKGYCHLLRAAALLADQPAGARLRFAAIGHDVHDGQRRTGALATAAGLADRVVILGQRDDVREWLAAADIFVLPSESEGMPLCIIEAMGQGLPVVASAVSGIPEQLGETGILLPDPTLDPEATARSLAAALITLASDAALRQSLGRSARQRALALFTAPSMIRAWTNLLASLAQAAAAAPRRYPDPAGYRPPNTVSLDRDLALGEAATAAELLKDGWSHAEEAGRWTDGGQARLRLGLPEAARDGFVLEMDGWPYRGGGDAPVCLTVTVCGREVGRIAWPGAPDPLEAALVCRPGTGRFPQQATIVLAIDGASSPAGHGGSDDGRELGFFLSRLRLASLPRPERGA